jgi:hypothetical protein
MTGLTPSLFNTFVWRFEFTFSGDRNKLSSLPELTSSAHQSFYVSAQEFCTASAPRASAAATPFPFAIPPAETTGVFTFSFIN